MVVASRSGHDDLLRKRTYASTGDVSVSEDVVAFTERWLEALAGFDPAALSGAQCAAVVEIMAVAGKVCAGAGARAAANPQDRDVPLVVSGDPVGHHQLASATVETTQIAPTILKLLGLRPSDLDAVRLEPTAGLPLG